MFCDVITWLINLSGSFVSLSDRRGSDAVGGCLSATPDLWLGSAESDTELPDKGVVSFSGSGMALNGGFTGSEGTGAALPGDVVEALSCGEEDIGTTAGAARHFGG